MSNISYAYRHRFLITYKRLQTGVNYRFQNRMRARCPKSLITPGKKFVIPCFACRRGRMLRCKVLSSWALGLLCCFLQGQDAGRVSGAHIKGQVHPCMQGEPVVQCISEHPPGWHMVVLLHQRGVKNTPPQPRHLSQTFAMGSIELENFACLQNFLCYLRASSLLGLKDFRLFLLFPVHADLYST